MVPSHRPFLPYQRNSNRVGKLLPTDSTGRPSLRVGYLSLPHRQGFVNSSAVESAWLRKYYSDKCSGTRSGQGCLGAKATNLPTPYRTRTVQADVHLLYSVTPGSAYGLSPRPHLWLGSMHQLESNPEFCRCVALRALSLSRAHLPRVVTRCSGFRFALK